MALLEVWNLTVRYRARDGLVHALRDLSCHLDAGSALAVVGESGSGKSTLLAALAGLSHGEVAGSARLEGRELIGLDARAWRAVRGRRMGVLFQETGDALDPTMPVGRQIAEVMAYHAAVPERTVRSRVAQALAALGLPPQVTAAYPHTLSGGMRRRALLALALAGDPALLLADEPTTGLDATVASQLAAVLAALRTRGLALLLVTHDLGLVASVANRVIVLYGGQAVEEGPVDRILEAAAHPYTQALVASRPPGPAEALQPLRPLEGMAPDPRAPSVGCRFAPRCPLAEARCGQAPPPSVPIGPDHTARCFLAARHAAVRP